MRSSSVTHDHDGASVNTKSPHSTGRWLLRLDDDRGRHELHWLPGQLAILESRGVCGTVRGLSALSLHLLHSGRGRVQLVPQLPGHSYWRPSARLQRRPHDVIRCAAITIRCAKINMLSVASDQWKWMSTAFLPYRLYISGGATARS
jgi:hypothetical protein